MNINRHNYEEFFLLYVDNELSAADQKAVELFVQENPDLEMELSALQQTILEADDVSLDKKSWLYMEDGVSALQENLLLYADDELSPADTRSMEALLATDKNAASEWNVLRQTKLEADTSIVFADKRSLYRKEEGRVVAVKWWRVAAAAVLLGFGVWTGVSVLKNNPAVTTGTGETIARKDQPASGKSASSIVPAETTNDAANAATETGSADPSVPVVNPGDPSGITNKQDGKNNGQPAESKKDSKAERNNIAVEDNNNKPSNNLPKPYSENINKQDRNEYAIAGVSPERNNSSASGANDVVLKNNPVIPDPATTAAIQVVYPDENNNNNDRYLYMDEDKVKRTKIGGFIRKAKRMLERTANVKTGDGLKVAGFEIALK